MDASNCPCVEFEERAAIREFDGNENRATAELAARVDLNCVKCKEGESWTQGKLKKL